MKETEPRGPLSRFENGVIVVVLGLMALFPVAEIVGRTAFGKGIPGSIPMVEHLTLWVALLGAALAARAQRLLALSTATFLPSWLKGFAGVISGFLGAAIGSALFWASIELVRVERDAGSEVALGIPVWVAMLVLPLGFALIALRLVWYSAESWQGRAIAAIGLVILPTLGLLPHLEDLGILLPASLVIVLGLMLGLPIFAAIGGLALLFFWSEGIPAASVPGEAYRLTASPMLPAVPLFTLAGYILSEGGASRRLLRLLTAFVGWMPGGLAVATTLVLAFFTPLTGASGVTILSMGGLLLPVLVRAKYPERPSIGLVTVSGSIGLLLPPSLPVILYGVTSSVSIKELFIGGAVPGLLLILLVAAWGVRVGTRSEAVRTPFDVREARGALWEAKWELLLPVAIMGSYFGGLATLVEAAALSVVLALLLECVIHRELSLVRDIPKVFVECATLVGGFLIILGAALAFTTHLILAEVPMHALALVQTYIESPLVFLLALNVFLLIVGGLMDIYSAIFVVVPLITPMAAAYGIDPLHLGIIFLANLELGYLTPPMGENLFLSAYRFDQPLPTLFRSTLPFWVLLLIGVLLITYVPALTLWPVELFAR